MDPIYTKQCEILYIIREVDKLCVDWHVKPSNFTITFGDYQHTFVCITKSFFLFSLSIYKIQYNGFWFVSKPSLKTVEMDLVISNDFLGYRMIESPYLPITIIVIVIITGEHIWIPNNLIFVQNEFVALVIASIFNSRSVKVMIMKWIFMTFSCNLFTINLKVTTTYVDQALFTFNISSAIINHVNLFTRLAQSIGTKNKTHLI